MSSEAKQTGGRRLEFDLSEERYTLLEDVLDQYIDHQEMCAESSRGCIRRVLSVQDKAHYERNAAEYSERAKHARAIKGILGYDL